MPDLEENEVQILTSKHRTYKTAIHYEKESPFKTYIIKYIIQSILSAFLKFKLFLFMRNSINKNNVIDQIDHIIRSG